uniref:cardiolipin synthase (CMP-forming) n=1 Tax=Oryzias sinensis TaxID=183150 RepID=A0A8C8DSD0_9TELE
HTCGLVQATVVFRIKRSIQRLELSVRTFPSTLLSFLVFRQYENPWTIPNLLCVCRILLAPFLGHLVVQQRFDLSLALFVLAGATDLLDGYIARRWPTQKSALGSALDPLADKILISILYVSLTYAELIPAPLTALVIFRDVGLIAAVFWVRYKTVPPPVRSSSYSKRCSASFILKIRCNFDAAVRSAGQGIVGYHSFACLDGFGFKFGFLIKCV